MHAVDRPRGWARPRRERFVLVDRHDGAGPPVALGRGGLMLSRLIVTALLAAGLVTAVPATGSPSDERSGVHRSSRGAADKVVAKAPTRTRVVVHGRSVG